MSLRPQSEQGVLRLKGVLALVPISRSTLYSEIAAGRFPRPVALSRRTRGWMAADLNDWLSARARPLGDDGVRLLLSRSDQNAKQRSGALATSATNGEGDVSPSACCWDAHDV